MHVAESQQQNKYSLAMHSHEKTQLPEPRLVAAAEARWVFLIAPQNNATISRTGYAVAHTNLRGVPGVGMWLT